jgi:hypothetical protein
MAGHRPRRHVGRAVNSMLRAVAVGAALLAALPTLHAARQGYQVTEGRCAGLPRLALRVAPGLCVGLAARALGAPRGVLPLPDGRLLVTDMGRWDAPTGRLLLLEPRAGAYAVRPVLKGLDRPHGLQLGPDRQ